MGSASLFLELWIERGAKLDDLARAPRPLTPISAQDRGGISLE